MLTIKKVNEEIQKKYPCLEIIKVNKRFYFAVSDTKKFRDEAVNLFYSNIELLELDEIIHIAINKINDFDSNDWLLEAEYTIDRMANVEFEEL